MSRPGTHWNPWPQKRTTVKDLWSGLESAAKAASKDPERFGVTKEQIDATANVAWAIKKGDKKRVEMLIRKSADKIIGGQGSVNEIMQWLDGLIREETMRELISRLEESARQQIRAMHYELQDMFTDSEAEKVIALYLKHKNSVDKFVAAAVRAKIDTRDHRRTYEQEWHDIWFALRAVE